MEITAPCFQEEASARLLLGQKGKPARKQVTNGNTDFLLCSTFWKRRLADTAEAVATWQLGSLQGSLASGQGFLHFLEGLARD